MDIIGSWEKWRDWRDMQRSGASSFEPWWILFFINGSSKMDEIHIMCDMFMDEAGIPMLITMSK